MCFFKCREIKKAKEDIVKLKKSIEALSAEVGLLREELKRRGKGGQV
ncbi:MAG: hypothetical protein QW507_00480 [Candidatus Nanoarchaeia archaeon]|nr:hypothetical protein [Candidatus Haiyanarchaeum thermophilum]MCW1302943.1 hypothetical protein [Candidatus Haiyanarchaeum thermophilum]MCW1303621.1 hypothetical protein [Candidatus Haiyanarchaeum thermophilum]MCW1306302.1 hypothetical protein [Candidatus Haiyanarchaeum thermophilum]MCW1307188.1 hypothetical protein [Candidatus Haiyanarchaeum thermophilum]